MKAKINDLEVIFVLNYKDEMIEKGIIPKDVKWDMLSKEQEENVKDFLKEKIEEKKRKC
jgi:predicted GTPase